MGCLGAARRTSELDVFLAVRDLDRSNAHGLFASWANPYGRGRRGVELAWLGHGASSCWYWRIAPWSQGTRGLYFCTSTEPFGEIRNPDGAISRLALSHREAGPRPQHVRFARPQRELALLRAACPQWSAMVRLSSATPTLRGAQMKIPEPQWPDLNFRVACFEIQSGY